MIDIVRHRRKLNINAIALKTPNLIHTPLNNTHRNFSENEPAAISLYEPIRSAPTAPYINLNLDNDTGDHLSDDNNNEEGSELLGISSTEPTRNVNDNDAKEETEENSCSSIPQTNSKSQSLDDTSTKSSVIMRKNTGGSRNFSGRRHELDLDNVENLKSYVRHRKNSIVHRVIGYNYDDHSTSGGLYIRAGIGSRMNRMKTCSYNCIFYLVFCLGTGIHSGLSILSSFENHHCSRWTAVMDDFSRLLFSFIQSFFIFKHSNVCV